MSLGPVPLGQLVAAAGSDPWLGLAEQAFPVLVVHGRNPAFRAARALLFALGAMRPRTVSLAPAPGEVSRLVIGRSRDECDLLIEDLSISRRHAALVHHVDGRRSIVDLGSVNGTSLRGERLAPDRPAPIAENETRLALGSEIELMVLQRARFPRGIHELRSACEREAITTTHAGKPVLPAIAADEFLASRVLDGIRLAPFTPASYDVVLDDGTVQLVGSWTDLVALIGRFARRLSRVEARPAGGGEPFVLDLRSALHGATCTIKTVTPT